MLIEASALSDRAHTAVHEAGHAVLQFAMGIGLKGVTIVPDFEERVAGHSLHGGEFGAEGDDVEALRIYAEDAFWLRHAASCYAGAEAVRQIRPGDDADVGSESDQKWAAIALANITDDACSLGIYFALAKRRCTVLVEHYRPEIELVAAALLRRDTLSEGDVRAIVDASMRERHAALCSW